MSKAGLGVDLLVRVADWGEVSIVETDGQVSELLRLPIGAGDDGAVAELAELAEAWRRYDSPAITRVVSAVQARVASGGDVLLVERQAPAGNTLEELLASHGPLDGVIVAGLFVELLGAVRDGHRKGLVFGKLAPRDLYVCPPGVTGVAALRAHNSGLPHFVFAAMGPLGTADDRRFQQLLDDLAAVPPEVADGAMPDAASDTFMICASVAAALLGQHLHEGLSSWALRHSARSGVTPRAAAELEELAPGFGSLIAKGMSVSPLLRRGVVSELLSAFEGLLGELRCRKICVRLGGDPWQMGSPLIPLAAYVRARPYAERFTAQRSAHRRRASVASIAAAPAAVGSAGALGTPAALVDQARLSAAIGELKMLRVKAERADSPGASTSVKVFVFFVAVAIAWSIAYIGFERTKQLSPAAVRERTLKSKTLSKPPQPRVLYTTPSQE